MLAICVHEYQHVSLRGARPGFDRRAIAFRVRVADHLHREPRAYRQRVIAGTVIDDDDFRVRQDYHQLGEQAAQPFNLVARRKNDGQVFHASFNGMFYG